MSKPKPSPVEQKWRDIAYILNYTFGEDHVTHEDRLIRVGYDDTDPVQQQLFAPLHTILGADFSHGMRHKSDAKEGEIWKPWEHGDAHIELTISKDQAPDELLEKLKETFGRQSRAKDGSKVILHPDDYFTHHLEMVSGVPWQQVVGGKYGDPVWEPLLEERPSAAQREEQEHAIAEVSVPAHPKVKIGGWIEHQQGVEEQTCSKPRTAIPADILNANKPEILHKLQNTAYSERERARIHKVFKGRE